MIDPPAPSAPHTDAFLAALAGAGIAAGRGEVPAGVGWQGEPGQSAFRPYAVLYPSPAGSDADLARPHAYLDYEAQITVVGATAEQAERILDRVKTALVGKKLAVTGRSSYHVQLEEGGRPVTKDDQVTPPEFYAAAIFSLRTAPA